MKKRIMLVLTVLMLAAPAGATVYIDCTVDGYDVTVHFDARTEPNLVRGFALDIELNSESGATVTGFAVDSFFDVSYPIYPGSIDINDTTGEVNDFGSPICDPCEYSGTLPGLNFAGMTVEFGSLYSPPGDGSPNAPDPCGTMFTVTVSGDCIVTIVENVIRGGVVLTNPNVDAVVTSPGITIGAGGCVVPDVVGDPNEAAQADIIAAGFTVTVYEAYDDVVALGIVISQSQAGGTEPGCGTNVDITVSLGPCVVPDVVGDPNEAAQTAIEDVGFTVNVTDDYNDFVAWGDVISQDPGPGVASCGSTVNIVVSLGSDCFIGMDDANLAQWTAAGRPTCWCFPRQCHGDADGIMHGPGGFLGNWWVGQPDLDIMSLGWLVKDPPKDTGIVGLEVGGVPVACADFGRDLHGPGGFLGNWRIGQPDLDEMSLYWLVKEPPKVVPPGQFVPDPNCLPGNCAPGAPCP